jgi:hypothetical protein
LRNLLGSALLDVLTVQHHKQLAILQQRKGGR